MSWTSNWKLMKQIYACVRAIFFLEEKSLMFMSLMSKAITKIDQSDGILQMNWYIFQLWCLLLMLVVHLHPEQARNYAPKNKTWIWLLAVDLRLIIDDNHWKHLRRARKSQTVASDWSLAITRFRCNQVEEMHSTGRGV